MKTSKLIRITTVPQSLKTLLKGQSRFMSEQGFEVIGVSSSGEELQEVATNEGIRVKAIELSRQITPLRDLQSLWKMYWFFKKERPQIVHTHTPKAGTVGMLAAKLAGVPHRLHTIAGLPLMETTGLKRKILDYVEKLTYACATKVYPNSKGLYDFIVQQNFTTENKLKIIANGSSNGVDTEYFHPQQIAEQEKIHLKKALNIGEDDFIFIFVGRLVGDKGINELVSAFKRVKEKTSRQVKLLLVGREERELDPLDVTTTELVDKETDILAVGYQSDVRPYFAVADCLAFPSYREGFPNVVMQAGAMGLPCIVSNINGCNEIVEEGKNGLIIGVKNTIELEQSMLNILSDEDLYSKLKANSRKMIISRYQQNVVWVALLEEYHRLLGKVV